MPISLFLSLLHRLHKVLCVVDHYGNWALVVAAAAVADGNGDGL